MPASLNSSPPRHDVVFRTTRWSIVHRAAAHDELSEKARANFCQCYWQPVYTYIRRAGYAPHDAEDLTQGFFQQLLEKNFLAAADREKGKLRTFLLVCVKRHLANVFRNDHAAKRGGGQVVSLEAIQAENHCAAEPVDGLTPDRLYQRRWALSLLDSVMEAVRSEFEAEGKEGLFEALKPYLGFGSEADDYQSTADRLQMKLSTVKSHILRLRRRWRTILLEEVGKTLDDPTAENIKEELHELIGFV